MTRKERNELCTLSETSFGTKYGWLDYLRDPYFVKEIDYLGREVKVTRYRTLEEVIVMMKGKSSEPEVLQESTTNVPEVNSCEIQDGSSYS